MLYLIGGAARTGKTILSERLLKEKSIPYFCLDFLVSAIDRNLHNIPSRQAAYKMMPYVEAMLRNIVEVKSNYLIEGDKLLPELVNKLIQVYPNQIVSCFLGYSSIDPLEKIKAIKEYPSHINDWTSESSEINLQALVTEILEYSKYIQTESYKYNLNYFDTSEDFSNTIDKAYQFLIQTLKNI